ncbi:MAG: glutathione peroxidase [Bryobacteraceae bacterium]
MTGSAFADDSVHQFALKSIDGANLPLSQYKGKVVLVVNTASKCGYTPQYSGLESLYKKYKDQGLVVLGVPANNFGAQEPGTEQEIKTFCSRNYQVTFPMTTKVSVKGDDQAPLYRFLSDKAGAPKWNFTKYLIGKDGAVIRKFDSAATPESGEVTSAIEQALKGS